MTGEVNNVTVPYSARKSWHWCGSYIDMYQTSAYCCRTSTLK